MADSLRYRLTDSRERRMTHLQDATGESTKSKALDTAIDHYIRMRGDSAAVPTGAIEELLLAAEERGSLTGEEIAEILTTDALPVEYQTDFSVGQDG